MKKPSFANRCIFDTWEGLCGGLSHFSQPSRSALIYALTPEDPLRIYDPQDLLRGHEPKLKEIYLDSLEWRTEGRARYQGPKAFGHLHREKNLQLTGLISFGGCSDSIFYQMWFAEHHPDMCAVGPTECWLEQAAWRLSHDLANEDVLYTGISGYFLREYSTHAVRDFIVDEMNVQLGWDSPLRIYPILEAVLAISKTREEGSWPRGELVFVEPLGVPRLHFLARFPEREQPLLENHKHVRKLLLAVEESNRKLISDGKKIVGIAEEDIPSFRITADFRRGYGFLRLNDQPVCSFYDGGFHSSTRHARLVEVEEALIESQMDRETGMTFFKVISHIVHHAEDEKHGCTVVLDLNTTPLALSGQRLAEPLDLTQSHLLELAASLSKVDGALHVGTDLKLHGFACLLDGHAIPSEDRARGARFNSALRFTAGHGNVIVIVVSADRPVSIIQNGVESNARCTQRPIFRLMGTPPTLESWIQA